MDRRKAVHTRSIVVPVTALLVAGWLIPRSLHAQTSRAQRPTSLRAFPNPILEDTTFETVVRSQPFPSMKYPVTILGWKEHPEEIYSTSTGALVFPRSRPPRGIYLASLVSVDGGAPALLGSTPEVRRLVDGYMPGVVAEWRQSGLQVRQLAFGMLLDGTVVRTGREPLIALVRYTLANPGTRPTRASLWLNFGLAQSGWSMKRVPPEYGRGLAYQAPCLLEPDGTLAACVLSPGVSATFMPVPRSAGMPQVTLNGQAATIKGSSYEVPVERRGASLIVGGRAFERGADLTFEASDTHALPTALRVEIAAAGGPTSLGWLGRAGLREQTPSGPDFILPGAHAAPIPWSVLTRYLPEGASRIALHAYYPTEHGPAQPFQWEPIVHFAPPGVIPAFRRSGEGNPRENSLRFDLSLRPGESRSVDLAVPYHAIRPPSPQSWGIRGMGGLNLESELARFRRYWARELNRNAVFDVPEARVRDSYRACLANNLMLTDHDPKTGLLLPHPDATMYEAVWAGDSGVILQAMDRMGYHRESQSWSRCFLVRQGTRKPSGDVDSWDGFFPGDVDQKWLSENGFILWALAEHYRLTGDRGWLKSVAPKLARSCAWVERERKRTKALVNGQRPPYYGLLPKGAPSDIGEWDYWYWTDSYTYMGLKEAADALADAGMGPEAAHFRVEAADYRKCILESIERSLVRDVRPPFIPPSPTKREKPSAARFNAWWYSISSPIYMVEAGLFSASDPKTAWTEHWLEQYGLYSGLPAFGAGGIDPHYVYNQALVQLLRGETSKFVWTLYSLLAYGQDRSTYATIEGMNLVTGSNGEAWDANRQPHMHSNSRVLDMVRIALLLEDGETLHLLAGTPRGWLANGKRLAVRRAPTYFGNVDLAAESHIDSGRIQVTIEPPRRRPCRIVLHVRPPSRYGTIAAVTVNGRSWPRFVAESVDLGRITSRTRIVCRFR